MGYFDIKDLFSRGSLRPGKVTYTWARMPVLNQTHMHFVQASCRVIQTEVYGLLAPS